MSAGLPRRLYRSRQDKMLGGVAAGLAAYFDLDPVLVRLLWVAGAVFTGGLIAAAYILLWIIVPQEGYAGSSSDVVRDNVNEMAAEAHRVGGDVREAFRREPTTTESLESKENTTVASADTTVERPPVEVLSPIEAEDAHRRRTMAGGVILLGLGLVFLAANLGLFRWLNWGLYWPLALVAVGALLLWNRRRV
jgi:phage shock protein C